MGSAEWLCGLELLLKRRRLIGARSPACGHSHVEQAQIDAELAAVLVPVTEHHIAQEPAARHGKNFLIAGDQAPGLLHRVIIKGGKHLAYRCDAVVQQIEHLLNAGRLRKLKIGRLYGAGLHEANDIARYGGEVVGELPCGERFCVRLPGQFVRRKPLQESACDGRLRFKFCE